MKLRAGDWFVVRHANGHGYVENINPFSGSIVPHIPKIFVATVDIPDNAPPLTELWPVGREDVLPVSVDRSVRYSDFLGEARAR